MAPCLQGISAFVVAIACGHVSGLLTRRMPLALMGSAEVGPDQGLGIKRPIEFTGLSHPVGRPTTIPCIRLSQVLLWVSAGLSLIAQVGAAARKFFCRVITAQMTRASLLATATAATIRGL